MTPRVVVVGGGLTGLATAWRLRDHADVVLLEADDQLGGQIRTTGFAGTALDVGADAFLARQPEGERLARDAGLGEHLVAPQVSRVALWQRRRLRRLPEATVFGVPTDVGALARSGALSSFGTARAALEPLIPRRFVAGDRSVADLVGERFGREVVDVLVEPLLGGVYAGSAEDLSAQATIPPVWTAATEHRSLMAGLRTVRRQLSASGGGPVFLTLQGGLSQLVERLRDDLGTHVHTGARVVGLRPDDAGWSLEVARSGDGPVVGTRGRATSGGGGAARAAAARAAAGRGDPDRGGAVSDRGERITADHVVLAVPAGPAARLLGALMPDAARELAAVRLASVGVVALAYDPDDAVDVPNVSGVLVPRTAGRLIKAVTVSSNKWPHLHDVGRFIVRASVGRIDDGAALELGDEELAERVDVEVRWALGIRAPARERQVVRWPDALPQYDVGHLQRVDRLRHAIAATGLDGLHIAGAALDGVGLAARAQEAEKLAARVRAAL